MTLYKLLYMAECYNEKLPPAPSTITISDSELARMWDEFLVIRKDIIRAYTNPTTNK